MMRVPSSSNINTAAPVTNTVINRQYFILLSMSYLARI